MESDQHRPRFVFPVQGGRWHRRRVGDTGRPAARSAENTGARALGPGSVDGEERFRALFEHAPLGVALSDLNGRFVEVNPALRDLLEATGVDPGTDGLADLARHLPEGSDEATAWRQALADVRDGRTVVARGELAAAPPGTTSRWVRVTTALVVFGGRRLLLSHLEDTTGQRLAEQRQNPLTRDDQLTGLALRDLLEGRLTAARVRQASTGLPTAVFCVAVDDVADDPDGDALLAVLGRRLTRALRSGDTVGRLGDAEFVVIAPEVQDDAALGDLLRRVEGVLAEPVDAGGASLSLGIAVGGTLAGPGDTFTAALHRAAVALATVRRARQEAADVELCDLRETDLRETDLRETDLRETDPRETDPRETDPRETGPRETGPRDGRPAGRPRRP